MESWREPHWVNKMTVGLDFSHMMSDFVGGNKGITQGEIDELIPRALAIAGNIEAKRKDGEWGFYQLPYDLEAANTVLEMDSSFQGKCDDFVILGILLTEFSCDKFAQIHNVSRNSTRRVYDWPETGRQ